MYNSDTELLFPARVAPSLRGLRGDKWKALVDQICEKGSDSVEITALTLMMVKLNGCVGCNVDSYRAMRGCTQCAQQSVKRFRESDTELIEQFERAFQEVRNHWGKDILDEAQG